MYPFHLRNASLILLVTLHLILVVIAAPVVAAMLNYDSTLGFGLGMAVSQALLLAVWIVLPAVPARRRLPYALVTAAVLLLVGSFGYSPLFGYDPRVAACLLFGLGASMWLLLLLARVVLGWRISLGPATDQAAPRGERQFHLRHLLWATAGCAVVLALFRGVLLLTNDLYGQFEPLRWSVMLLVLLLGSLPGVAIVGLFCDGQSPRRWVLVCAGLLALNYLVVIVAELLTAQPNMPSTLAQGLLFVTLFEVNLCVSVGASLMIWRYGALAYHRPAAEQVAATDAAEGPTA